MPLRHAIRSALHTRIAPAARHRIPLGYYTKMRRLAFLLMLGATAAMAQQPTPVKVLVVAMFERGPDTGDEPGEFQFWVERNKLERSFSFPQGYHDLRMNADGVLGVLTGVGNSKSAATIMALGLDSRFD